jgi:hypothetical protein
MAIRAEYVALLVLALWTAASQGQGVFASEDAPDSAGPTPRRSGATWAGDRLPDDGREAPDAEEEPAPPRAVAVWGDAELRGYAFGDQVAPNGQEFKALFRLDLDFNFWVWQSQGVYLFGDTRFWGQRASPGVTNANQGAFDFSKREFDFTGGVAWNYCDRFEARAFAYSFNNLNRGSSLVKPTGYADGIGLENRLYLNEVYDALGTEDFDVSRATFLSAGFYPSKNMVDSHGNSFHPGPFARAVLTYDLLGEKCYLYGDFQFLGTRSFTPKRLDADAGVAVRPWDRQRPRLEFRLGASETYDLQNRDPETNLYGSVRITY